MIAEKDGAAAAEWTSAQPAGPARTAALATVAEIWSARNPHGAAQWLDTMLGTVMEHAPSDTFARLDALPAGAERDRLMECAFMESMWHTPREQLFGDGEALAWRFYAQLPEDAQIAKAALFGEKRAENGDLKNLGEWAQNFPPGPARSNAIAAAMSTSYRRKASQVEPLLASTVPGPDRDAALSGLAEAARTSAPADAASRALAIGDNGVRRDTLEGVIVPWLKKDPTASRTWLQNAGAIPGAWKQEWLKSGAASAEP